MTRPCPICNQPSSHVHAEENFSPQGLNPTSFASRKEPELFHHRLLLCEKCDLIFAQPSLSQDAIEREYQVASFDSSVEAGYAARTYAAYLPEKSRITSALDIGTGGGEFLLELHRAKVPELQGIEPSVEAIKTAHPSVKNFIKEGFFSKQTFSDKNFDLISCFQTLEHVPDPLQLSKDAFSLLREGGRFYVITHNFRGMVNRILEKKSPIYDIEHLQLFSQVSLRNLLATAGFTDIKVFPIINTYPLFYWIKLLPLIPRKRDVVTWSKKIKAGYIPIPLPIGNIAAIATKGREQATSVPEQQSCISG